MIVYWQALREDDLGGLWSTKGSRHLGDWSTREKAKAACEKDHGSALPWRSDSILLRGKEDEMAWPDQSPATYYVTRCELEIQ